MVFRLRFGDPFVFQSPWKFYEFHFLRQIHACTFTICYHGQISCTIPRDSPFLLCRSLLYYSLRVFRTSFGRRSFTGVRVTANLLRTLLTILADLNNAVVWIFPSRPPIFNSSSPLSRPLGTFLSAPITIGCTVTFMFHNIFRSLAWSLLFL